MQTEVREAIGKEKDRGKNWEIVTAKRLQF